MVVVQSDRFNASRIRTVIVVPLTSNLRLGALPGNVRVETTVSGLPNDSVVNLSQVATVDRSVVKETIGRLPPARMDEVDRGLKLVLGL